MAQSDAKSQVAKNTRENQRPHQDSRAIESTSSLNASTLESPLDAMLGGDFSQSTLERHATLLGNSRMSHPMYAQRRATIVQRLQRDYGNMYVQRVFDQIKRNRNTAASLTGVTGATIQRYQKFTDEHGAKYRFSDDYGMAVSQEMGGGGQEVWATPALVKDANKKLKDAKSGIKVVAGKGKWEIENGDDLVEVQPKLRNTGWSWWDDPETKKLKAANRPGWRQKEDSEGVKDETLALWTDCGRASRVVTGGMVAAVYKKGDISKRSVVSKDPKVFSNTVFGNVIVPFMEADVSTPYLKENVHYQEDPLDSNQWLLLAPANLTRAKRMYWELGKKGRDAFDKFAGINAYANPEIGGTYTMVTEKQMPGYSEVGPAWNFHWAGVIMKHGGDNLTLEGYAVMAPKEEIVDIKKKYKGKQREKKLQELRAKYAAWINRGWMCQMYGTKSKVQTFHGQHLRSGTHGTRATTLAAGKKKK